MICTNFCNISNFCYEIFSTTALFLQGVSIACYASPVLAIVGMSVCLSVRHTLALSVNDAS